MWNPETIALVQHAVRVPGGPSDVLSRIMVGAQTSITVGLIAVALPLTIGSGNSQLTAVVDDSATIGVGLLLARVAFGQEMRTWLPVHRWTVSVGRTPASSGPGFSGVVSI